MTPLPIVSCDNCGACCMRMGVPPFSTDDDIEWDRLPPELQQEIIEFQQREDWASLPCLWLDLETRRCRHYDLRPDVCERFVPGNPICLEDRELMARSQPSAS